MNCEDWAGPSSANGLGVLWSVLLCGIGPARGVSWVRGGLAESGVGSRAQTAVVREVVVGIDVYGDDTDLNLEVGYRKGRLPR